MNLHAPHRIGPGKRTHAKRTNGPNLKYPKPHQGPRECARRAGIERCAYPISPEQAAIRMARPISYARAERRRAARGAA